MFKTAISSLAFVLIASPAFAGDLNDAKAACAATLASQANKSIDGAKTKLVKGRDGGTQRVTVRVTFPDGATLAGQCKVKGDEVQSFALES